MTTKAKYNAGVQTFFDSATFETVFAMSPLFFEDDFIGARGTVFPTSATAGEPWVKKIVGAAPPTVGAVANAAGGQVACTLTTDSQKEDAVLYFGDSLTFDVTKGLVFESRVNLSVLPSATGVQTVFGLSSAWIDGPDNASYYLEFGATANGAINMRSKDGVTTSSVSSGTTVVAGDWHVYRIDATVLTDVKFFIDGSQVSTTGAISFAATGANAILQPYVSCYKPSGAGVATTVVDVLKVLSNRV